ncbi:hypothetical protein [Caproiciproducens galactitolivorans]|uniref:hypothetical protein n=1 Tax=Caproiciproducens galactitolivorans TaxID=642589 RepID=UPI00240A716E|nr:hypothetical protein [Caproiciproducens galactitolivorans]
MRKLLTGILLLSGILATAGRVMRKRGCLSSVKPSETGIVGAVEKDDRPFACFAVKWHFPLVARDCKIRFFSTIAKLSSVLLLRSRQRGKPRGRP